MVVKLLMKLSFTLARRVKFYRIMARATDEKRMGVKPTMVLASLINFEEKRNRGRKTSLSLLYRYWQARIELGKKFGEVLHEFVPAAEAAQIFAAEMSGRISDGMRRAMVIANQQTLFKQTFSSALVGPLINLVMGLIVLYLFLAVLIPSLASSINHELLSPYSLFILKLAAGFGSWFPLLIVSLVLMLLWIIWAMPNYNGIFRLSLDRLPPFSMYKLMVGCSFLHALHSLMKG